MISNEVLNTKILEIQSLIGVFLTLRLKLQNARVVIPAEHLLLQENRTLNQEIVGVEKVLFDILPVIGNIRRGVFPSVRESWGVFQELIRIHTQIQDKINKVKNHLRKVHTLTGVSIVLQRPPSLFRLEYAIIGLLLGYLILRSGKI